MRMGLWVAVYKTKNKPCSQEIRIDACGNIEPLVFVPAKFSRMARGWVEEDAVLPNPRGIDRWIPWGGSACGSLKARWL